MSRHGDPARQFWRAVLADGGLTAIPRWTLEPVPGIAGHEVPVPEDHLASARRLAADLGVTLEPVLLAAHAKVLAALSGESEVVTGYVPGGDGRPLPCRLTTGPATWRALVQDAQRMASGVREHRAFPVDDVRRELGLPAPSFETVFDPAGTGGHLDGPRTPCSGWTSSRARASASCGCGTGPTCSMPPPPPGSPATTSPRSRSSRPIRTPSTRGRACSPTRSSASSWTSSADRSASCRTGACTRSSRTRVRAHPDAVAAVHRDRQWTYRELDARANRLARALLARGLRHEDVVAVVTERNLDWMAAVLAIWKAGGAYLPLEPHFPAGRIGDGDLPRRVPARPHRARERHHPRRGARVAARRRAAARRTPPTPRTTPTTTSASPSAPTSSPTSSSPPGPPGSRRARCASTSGCSTTSTPSSATWRSARARSSRRRGPSASTSRCGSWSGHWWSAGGPCWSTRRSSSTSSGSSTRSSRAGRPCSRSCRPTSTSSCPTWSSTRASCRTCTRSAPPATS